MKNKSIKTHYLTVISLFILSCSFMQSTVLPSVTNVPQSAMTETAVTMQSLLSSATSAVETSTITPTLTLPSTGPTTNGCTANWFFTFDGEHLSLGAFCPQPVMFLDAVGQDFEGGRAYRYAPDPSYTVDQRGTIYIIYNDGEWVTFPDSWDSSQPASDPALVVPDARYQPVDGIGKVWRNVPEVRARLGWAYEPQSNFQGRIQTYLTQADAPSGDTHYFFIDHGKWGTVLWMNSVDMGPNQWEVAGSYP